MLQDRGRVMGNPLRLPRFEKTHDDPMGGGSQPGSSNGSKPRQDGQRASNDGETIAPRVQRKAMTHEQTKATGRVTDNIVADLA